MIQAYGTTPDAITVSTSQVYGGIDIQVGMHHNVLEVLSWIQSYRSQLQKESELRSQNPELQHLYDQYQTYLKLISEPK